jgi:PII-like signaling protein
VTGSCCGSSPDHHGRKPLYQAIVETLREHGLAGATVLRGIEGFGAHSRLRTHRILCLSEDLPIVIEVADQAERIDAILPTLDAMVTEVEPIHIIAYRADNVDRAGMDRPETSLPRSTAESSAIARPTSRSYPSPVCCAALQNPPR